MACPQCFSGSLDEGTPVGKESTLGDIPVYVASPPEGKSCNAECAVVIISDLFGWTLVNSRLIADQEAEALGARVYLPDLYGWCCPPSLADKEVNPAETFLGRCGQWAALLTRAPQLLWWMLTHGDGKTLPKLETVFTELRKAGVSKIVCQGYCWGGRYSVLMGATDYVDGYIVAHPAFVKVPKDIEAVNKPGFFIMAEDDHTFSNKDQARSKKILTEKGLDVTFTEYKGTIHGFAVRGNKKDPVVLQAREDALKASVEFVRRVCRLPPPQ